MKIFIPLILIFFIQSCSKPRTVLICGDHICINKDEAEQYFKENLTIEVKIIDKKKKKKVDLVELNLKENSDGDRKVNIFSKKKTDKNLKKLSKPEIARIKESIRNKKKEVKKIKQTYSKNRYKSVNKRNTEVVDVCTIIKKCSIDEISKYLLDKGKKKKFPDITRRQ
tara:strand:+ start:12475 stop:12978 length:504 start_codon:yes stop_codon:yes gene_type:complete